MTVRVVRATRRPTRVAPVPAGEAFQTIHGFGAGYRAWTHPDFWGIGQDGTGGAGTVPVLTSAQKNEIVAAVHDPVTGCGVSSLRTVEPTTSALPGITTPSAHVFDIEPSNDNADPAVYNAAGFTFAGPRVQDIADYFGRARDTYGVSCWFSPLGREKWMGVSSANDAAEYAEWLLAIVRAYSATYGQPLQYLGIANEPSYTRNTMSGAFMRDVIKNLGPRLEAEGLLVPIVIPDDVRSTDAAAKTDTIMADATAAQYVGVLATHLYDEALSNLSAMRSRATTHGKPLWMTEMSTIGMSSMGLTGTDINFAVLMHDLLSTYNCEGVDYLFATMGQQETEAVLVQCNYSGSTYTGVTIRKMGHYFGQYSRYVRSGDKRVQVSSSDAGARVTMFWRVTGRRTIVAVNAGAAAVTTTISAPDLAGVSSVTPIRSSGTETWATLTPINVTSNAFSATLPATSVTTFVGDR